jgi:hypothetical protein
MAAQLANLQHQNRPQDSRPALRSIHLLYFELRKFDKICLFKFPACRQLLCHSKAGGKQMSLY